MFDPTKSVASLLTVLLLAGTATAQDAVRTWGPVSYDTDAFRLPILRIATNGILSVLRADGRIMESGGTTSSLGTWAPPDPPVGLHYVDMSYGWPLHVAVLSDGNAVTWSGVAGGAPQAPVLPSGVGYAQVSAGYSHVFGLRSDGVLEAWGWNTAAMTVPQLPAGASVVKCFAGSSNSLLLLSTGDIVAWGSPTGGILNVPPLPSALTYTELYCVNAYYPHAIARRSDGSLVSWGDNFYGQSNIPALPVGVTYVDFALGSGVTLALRSDGQLAAWGDNTYGACNLTPLPPGASVVQIAASSGATHALLADGTMRSWGAGRGRALPLPPAGQRWVDAAGVGWYLTLTSDGEVLGFGPDDSQGLTIAPPLPPGLRYERVFVSGANSAVLRSDGQLFLWGYNFWGQTNLPSPPPGVSYVDVAMSSQHTVAVRTDGQAVGVGNPSFGVLSIPTPPPGVNYVGVDVNYLSTVLLRSDGNVVHLGDPAWNTVPALPPGQKYVDIACGYSFAAALRSDGEIVVWGSMNPAAGIPALPPGVVYVEISAGRNHVVARRSDGEVVVCGYSFQWGQGRIPPLLQGESCVQVSADNHNSMVRVGPPTRYVTIANGCAGTLPATRLVPRDTPRLDATLKVTLFDLPNDVAFMAFGWNQITPVPLAQYGMPGCFQHITIDNTVLLLGQNHQAVFELPIPNASGFVGLHFFNQAVVLDTAANALGAVVSDAAEGVIGHW